MAADEVSELLRTFETALHDIERKLQSFFADNADFVKSVRLLQQIRLYLYIFFVILLWYKSDRNTPIRNTVDSDWCTVCQSALENQQFRLICI